MTMTRGPAKLSRIGRQLLREESQRAAFNADVERHYRKLCRKLLRVTIQMEEIAENDMGVVGYHRAVRFHALTNRVRLFTVDLVNGVDWPEGPPPEIEEITPP